MNLRGKTLEQRGKFLISITHAQFRGGLLASLRGLRGRWSGSQRESLAIPPGAALYRQCRRPQAPQVAGYLWPGGRGHNL